MCGRCAGAGKDKNLSHCHLMRTFPIPLLKRPVSLYFEFRSSSSRQFLVCALCFGSSGQMAGYLGLVSNLSAEITPVYCLNTFPFDGKSETGLCTLLHTKKHRFGLLVDPSSSSFIPHAPTTSVLILALAPLKEIRRRCGLRNTHD